MAAVDALRTRRSFARLKKTVDVPNLIDIQRRSFAWLTDPSKGGLRETIDDISPIEDYTGNLAVQFGEFTFDEPVASLDQCREKDLTYARPLTVTVAFINRETGEIREQSVFMGDFPWMTERGTFVINGTERVVVTQLVRSPGAYLMEPKDREKQVFIANLMPARGSWLELEIDKKGKVFVRIDRKRKLPVTVLLRAMGYATDEEILRLFDNSLYIRNTIESDTEVTRTEEGALIELFKKQRPGEPPSVDNAKALLNQLFFDPKRYDLTRVGSLQAQLAARPRRRHRHAHAHPRRHPRAGARAGVAAQAPRPARGRRGRDQGLRGRGDEHAARAGRRAPRRVRALRQPPPAHRRRADPGGLPDRPLPHGARRARAPDDRGRRHDHAADDHQHPPGRGGAEGVLRLLAAQPVHGPDQLAGGAHAPPPPVGAGRRRADARARADRGARRAPDPLRAHVPDRDARGTEHRPDRLAVLVRRGLRVRLRDDPLPRRQGRRRDRQGRAPRRHPGRGARDRPGEHAGRPQDRPAEGHGDPLPHAGRPVRDGRAEGRRPGGCLARADLVGGDRDDPVPRARRRQPRADGLEHAAPGGAAAEGGRAARRHRHGAPRGARHRRRAAGHAAPARSSTSTPTRSSCRAERQEGRVRAAEVHALQPGHADPPQAAREDRPEGQGGRRARRRLLDRPGRDGARQEPDGRVHVLGGLQLRGRDHPVQAPRAGRRAHLDPHRGVRDRRPHDQARRGGDHARHPQPLGGVAAQPRRPRHRARRRRGRSPAICSSARSRPRARPS